MKRKEILKQIVLNNKCYDIEIYRLIDLGALDTIIPKLRKRPKIFDEENKVIDSNEHIIMLLNNFVHFFKINFKELCPFFSYVLETIFKYNTDLFIKFLNEDKIVNNEKYFSYYQLWNYKLSSANFIKNTYFNSIKKVFENNKISIKNINEYTDSEICKIFDLLKKYSKYQDLIIALLFDNIYVYTQNFNITEDTREKIYITFDGLFNSLLNLSNSSNY